MPVATRKQTPAPDVGPAAIKAIAAARIRLIVGSAQSPKAAFFASVVMGLDVIECQFGELRHSTMATDGERLYFYAPFVLSLSGEELLAVLCHEVLHVTNAHPARRGDREPKRWNVACDLAINCILRDCGYWLPRLALMPGEGDYRDFEPFRSAEEYYQRLPEGAGEGPDGWGWGGVLDPGDNGAAARAESEARAKMAAAGAAHAAQRAESGTGRGDMPGSLVRSVETVLKAKVDWHAELARFVDRQAKLDYSFARPNRRHVWRDLILPGYHGEDLGHLYASVDLSGSITAKVVDEFSAELNGVLEAFNCQLTILYHDTHVTDRAEWQSTDGPLQLRGGGGGGTSHRDVFREIDQEFDRPTCLICLTDLYTDFPSHEPDYPVLWAVAGNPDGVAPFGHTIHIPEPLR